MAAWDGHLAWSEGSGVHIYGPIFTKIGIDVYDHNFDNPFAGGLNRNSTSGFMRMRSVAQC